MEKTFENIRFKIGDEVKFKTYIGWPDWTSHLGEIGKIINFRDGERSTRVQWKDGFISATDYSNLLLITKEWDI